MKPHLHAPHFELSVQWTPELSTHPLHALMPKRHILKCLQTCLQTLDFKGPVELSVRFVHASEAQALNRDYRQRRYTPNVLTFAYSQSPVLMADLVLCAPVLEKEALALNRSLKAHASHLLVHACLHAMGFDHEGDEWQALQMECLEVMVLDLLKVDNPYAP